MKCRRCRNIDCVDVRIRDLLAIENLPAGGTRLVCMSVDGAAKMRRRFRSELIKTPVIRSAYRPRAAPL